MDPPDIQEFVHQKDKELTKKEADGFRSDKNAKCSQTTFQCEGDDDVDAMLFSLEFRNYGQSS